MGKLIKRILIGFATFILLITLVCVIAGYVLEGKVRGIVLSQIQNQLTVPINAKSGVEFSLLRHFPYASLTLKDFSIDDKLRKGKTLINVKELSLLCNVLSLTGKQIELTKVLIADGSIDLFTNQKGQTNFDIIKPSTDTAKSPSKNQVSILLKKAELNQVEFDWKDLTQEAEVDITIQNLLLTGNFSADEFDLTNSFKAKVKKVTSAGQTLASNRNLKGEVSLSINNISKHYSFKKSKLEIDESEFEISGFFASLANGTQLDFKLNNEGKDVRKLLVLFPEQFKALLAEAEGSGEYAISANIKGLISAKSNPHVALDARLKNSELKLSKYNKLLKKVNASAHYEIDEHGKDKVEITNFDCELNAQPFQFRLSLANLSDPEFDFYAKGVIPLTEISSFVPDSVVQDLGGTVTINDFRLKGRKKDFALTDSSGLIGSGGFKLNNVELRQNGITYGNINGSFKYNNQLIEAKDVTVNFVGTQANFSGIIQNLPAFIINLNSVRNANNVVLGINGKLSVPLLNLTGIIDAYSKKNQPQLKAAKGKIDLREILNMQGSLDIDIGKFLFRKIEASDVHGNLQINPGTVQCTGLSLKAMDGSLQADGNFLIADDYSVQSAYHINCSDLNITKIFYECENFGQQTMTDKNLKGLLDASVYFNSTLLNYNQIDEDKLSGLMEFTIHNGELINFEPLRAASKYIKVSELQDIRFATLTDTLKIANRRVDIPQFTVESNVLNLMMDGYHYFNDTIDYHIKINLHKFLAQKFNRKLLDINYMEDDPFEGLNLYLSMTGDMSNPKIKSEKGAVRKKVQANFLKEKQQLANLAGSGGTAKGN